MRLLMAVSADGYLCLGPNDDMKWTGPTDKKLFRALTSVGGVCAVGVTTYHLTPSLDGRQLIPLSRRGYTLDRLQEEHPDAWLLGGPTVAKAALDAGLVTEAHINEVNHYLGDGVPMRMLQDRTPELGGPMKRLSRATVATHFGSVTHRVYRL